MSGRAKPFKVVKEQMELADQKIANFKYVQKSLQDLETVHKMVLPSMLEVANQNHNEQLEQINDAAY